MKKLLPTLITGTLAITLLIPSSVFAKTATINEIPKERGRYEFLQKNISERHLDNQQILDLVEKYAPELKDDFQNVINTLMNKKEFIKIDEITKEKIIEIKEKVKGGELTQEQAREEIEALGINEQIKIVGQGEIDNVTEDNLVKMRMRARLHEFTPENNREKIDGLEMKGRTVERATKVKLGIDIRSKIQQAIEANDEDQIENLLNELLNRLEERINNQ